MKKIWIVSEFYYPIVTSTGYYMTEIAEYLAKKGMDVHVICSNSKYNEVDEMDFFQIENHNQVHIERVFVSSLNKNNFIKRLFGLTYTSIKLFNKLYKRVSTGDKILVVTNPAFLLLMLPFLKAFKRTNHVILVHDIFPENLSAVKKLNKKSFLYKILKKIFDLAYKNAETLISIGRDMSAVLKNKTSKTDVCLIPNWADDEVVRPICKETSNTYKEMNVRDKLVYQFAGNLGHAQGLDNLLKAITLIKSSKVHFLFIGGGAKVDSIKKFISDERCSNISYLGYKKRIEQNDFLNACDISIVTLSEGMYGLGVPSKSYNIMAAGKPILFVGDDNSEIALVIKEHEIGWVVEPNNPHKLAEVIDSISQMDQHDLQRMGKISRKLAESKFSRLSILEEYYNLLNE